MLHYRDHPINYIQTEARERARSLHRPGRQPMSKGIDMLSNSKKLIAVIGATGQQGGGVVRALQASGQFKVRALTRNPDKHRELADEVVKADLDRPETLNAAFEAAHGVFLVTNF